MTTKQISDRTREAAEQYRQASSAWFALNIDTAADRECRSVHQAYVNAATRLAERVLIDLETTEH